MNTNAPWTKERIADSPIFYIMSGEERLACTDEETADRVIEKRNFTPQIDYMERAADAEAELRAIDSILDRRDALDDLPGRKEKILKAIELCRTTDTFNDLGRMRDAVVNFLTVWDGADMKNKLEVFADAVRQLREARDHVGK